jgi:hypothetical protein
MMSTETILQPSACGFRSIRPRTRKERRDLKDKVSLEKSRIDQRVGYEARLHRMNAPESSAGLTSLQSNAAGYISDADRFHTDTAGEQYHERQLELEKKKRAEEFRRNQTQKREEERWKQIEETKLLEEQRLSRLRTNDGIKARKNQSNAAYNVVNLQYHDDIHGEQQKYHDEMVKFRAQLRTKALVEHGDSRASYNIISGESRHAIPDPTPAPRPSSLVGGNMSSRVDHRRIDMA